MNVLKELREIKDNLIGYQVVFIRPEWLKPYTSIEDQKAAAYEKYPNPTFVIWGKFNENS